MSADALPDPPESRLGHTTGVVLCVPGPAAVHALRPGAHSLAERTALLLGEICHTVVVVDADALSRAASELEMVAVALDTLSGEQALVVSADRPLLSPDLLIGLAGLPDADAAIPRDASGVHLTCARYRVRSARALREAPAAGSADAAAALAGLDVCWLEGESLAALDPRGDTLARVADGAALDALAARDAGTFRAAWPGHPGAGLRAPDA